MSLAKPLAHVLRPEKLEDFVGQEELLAPNSWLREAIVQDSLPSLIFWGAPGCGKTSLARIIAKETKAEFIELASTESGVKDLREIIDRARSGQRLGIKTILFIDEIHRWNKAQQDYLLPQLETGLLTLIGATTENPSFSINSALLSRLKVLDFKALKKEDLEILLNRASKKLALSLDKKAKEYLLQIADGDARSLLGIIEIAALKSKQIDLDLIKEISKKPALYYTKNADEHYHLISALHKSMRGGDLDAALYYLARMLESGADPLYIARRLLRFASEDIGLANNSALLLANAAFNACKEIGMPECNLNLAHAVAYLTKSPKSADLYLSYQEIVAEIAKSGSLAVPLQLRNASTKLSQDLGYAKGYRYSPLEDDSTQEYLPEALLGRKFFKKRTKGKKDGSISSKKRL